MPKKPKNEDVPDDGIGDIEEDEEEEAAAPETIQNSEIKIPNCQMPVHAGGFLEYATADGPRWRCDRAAELLADYKIAGTPGEQVRALEEWHRVMAPVPAMWQMLRRWYRCAPLMGAVSPDDLRDWTREDLAASLGFSVGLLERQLEETRDFWHKVQLEKELAGRMAATATAGRLDLAKVGELVERYGFRKVPAAEHPYVALRITEMSHLFELAEGRMLAQSAIFQELMIRHQQDLIAVKMGDAAAGSASETTKLMDGLKSLQTSYEATLEKLGATQDQNPNFRQKLAFNDSVGQITKAIQAYYAEDDTALIDGIFTETEVKLLLTPTTLRPQQYRPDLTLLAQEWKRNFWNPEYDAEKLPREVHRRLLKGFDEGVRAQMVEDGESLPDMEGEDGVDILDAASEALNAAGETEGGADVGTAMPDDAVLPEERNGRPGKDEVVCI